jgi:hypothetical protein
LMIVVELTELRLVFTILWVLLNISSDSMDRQVSFVNHLDLVELHPVNIQLSLADIQHFGVSFRSDSSSFWRLLLGPLLGLFTAIFQDTRTIITYTMQNNSRVNSLETIVLVLQIEFLQVPLLHFSTRRVSSYWYF